MINKKRSCGSKLAVRFCIISSSSPFKSVNSSVVVIVDPVAECFVVVEGCVVVVNSVVIKACRVVLDSVVK